jgi:hypothetical protein
MHGFKLFMEGTVEEDVKTICKTIAAGKDPITNFAILRDYIGETLGNNLKANYMTKILENLDPGFSFEQHYQYSPMRLMVKNGILGFCTHGKIDAYLRYVEEGNRPDLRMNILMDYDGYDNAELAPYIPFKKEICDAAINGQMGIAQHIGGLTNVKLDMLDFSRMYITTFTDRNGYPHNIPHSKWDEAERLIEAHLRAYFNTSNISYFYEDFEDYNQMLYVGRD